MLLSVCTPVTSYFDPYYGFESYTWLWGLNYNNYGPYGGGFQFNLLQEPLFIMMPWFFSHFSSAVIILIGSLALIVIGNRVRTGKTNIKDKENKLIKLGVLMIIAPIIFVISSYIFGNIYYDYVGYGGDFELFAGASNPGFAFIGPFIGAALAIVGGFISKKMISREEAFITEEKKEVTPVYTSDQNYKKYLWVLPLISGILMLLSILTPSAYIEQMGQGIFIWIYGLFEVKMYGSSQSIFLPLIPGFLQYTLPIFLSGIIPVIIIIICSVEFLTSANKVRLGKRNLKEIEKKMIGNGITVIIASIIYIVAIDITWGNLVDALGGGGGYFLPNFWNTFDPGFAIIAPFIGASLGFIVVVANRMTKQVQVEEKRDLTTKKPISAQFKHCPECGQQLISTEIKFCTSCGFELNYYSLKEQ